MSENGAEVEQPKLTPQEQKTDLLKQMEGMASVPRQLSYPHPAALFVTSMNSLVQLENDNPSPTPESLTPINNSIQGIRNEITKREPVAHALYQAAYDGIYNLLPPKGFPTEQQITAIQLHLQSSFELGFLDKPEFADAVKNLLEHYKKDGKSLFQFPIETVFKAVPPKAPEPEPAPAQVPEPNPEPEPAVAPQPVLTPQPEAAIAAQPSNAEITAKERSLRNADIHSDDGDMWVDASRLGSYTSYVTLQNGIFVGKRDRLAQRATVRTVRLKPSVLQQPEVLFADRAIYQMNIAGVPRILTSGWIHENELRNDVPASINGSSFGIVSERVSEALDNTQVLRELFESPAPQDLLELQTFALAEMYYYAYVASQLNENGWSVPFDFRLADESVQFDRKKRTFSAINFTLAEPIAREEAEKIVQQLGGDAIFDSLGDESKDSILLLKTAKHGMSLDEVRTLSHDTDLGGEFIAQAVERIGAFANFRPRADLNESAGNALVVLDKLTKLIPHSRQIFEVVSAVVNSGSSEKGWDGIEKVFRNTLLTSPIISDEQREIIKTILKNTGVPFEQVPNGQLSHDKRILTNRVQGSVPIYSNLVERREEVADKTAMFWNDGSTVSDEDVVEQFKIWAKNIPLEDEIKKLPNGREVRYSLNVKELVDVELESLMLKLSADVGYADVNQRRALQALAKLTLVMDELKERSLTRGEGNTVENNEEKFGKRTIENLTTSIKFVLSRANHPEIMRKAMYYKDIYEGSKSDSVEEMAKSKERTVSRQNESIAEFTVGTEVYKNLRNFETSAYANAFLAKNAKGDLVVIKVAQPNMSAQQQKEFEAEVATAKQLEYYQITVQGKSDEDVLSAKIIAEGASAERPFLVMSAPKGIRLPDIMKRAGGRQALPDRELGIVFAQVCDALTALHDGIGKSFYDLKSSNIFWDRVSGNVTVWDLSILRPRTFAEGVTVPFDPAADVYSLSKVLFQMSSGKVFSEAVSPEQQLDGARISPFLKKILAKGLAMKIENRYQKAEELQKDLILLQIQ